MGESKTKRKKKKKKSRFDLSIVGGGNGRDPRATIAMEEERIRRDLNLGNTSFKITSVDIIGRDGRKLGNPCEALTRKSNIRMGTGEST